MPSRRRERADLHWLVISSGSFAVALVLSLTGVTTQLIDAGIHLDVSAIAFLNRLARRSRTVDALIWQIWTTAALQGGVVVALVWGAWFSRSEEFGSRLKRATLLSSFIGMYVCLLVTLVLRAALPFRLRPANDFSIFHQMPSTRWHEPRAPRNLIPQRACSRGVLSRSWARTRFSEAGTFGGSPWSVCRVPATTLLWAPLCD